MVVEAAVNGGERCLTNWVRWFPAVVGFVAVGSFVAVVVGR